jgi:hypothetical protein
VIKGCNIFGVKNWQTLAALWAGALSCNKKISRQQNAAGRTPLNVPTGGEPLLLYKILHLLFFLWYELFVHYARVEQNYQHGLDARHLEIQFLRPRGCLTNPFRTLSLCFGVIGKTTVLISRNNFV